VIDWTVSVGNLIQIVTLLCVSVSVFVGLSWRIKGVEKELEKLANVVITQAVQTTKIDHLSQRIDDLERDRVAELYPQMLKRHQI
jgi:hypothetical protein